MAEPTENTVRAAKLALIQAATELVKSLTAFLKKATETMDTAGKDK